MKLITSLFLSFLILISVPTQASANEGLKRAFDELNYSLSVEWDQKDQAFYDAAVSKFEVSVKELQEAGLTNEEIITFSLSQVKNKKFSNDLRMALELINAEKLDEKQTHDLMVDMLNKSYQEGASWQVYWGGVMTYGIVAAFILILGVALSAGNNNQQTN